MLGLGNLDYYLRGPLKTVLNFCVNNLFHTKKKMVILSLSQKNVNKFFFAILTISKTIFFFNNQLYIYIYIILSKTQILNLICMKGSEPTSS